MTSLRSRRFRIGILLGALAMSLVGAQLSPAEYFTPGTEADPFSKLKTGDYVWLPQLSPSGPVLIVVSIPKQRCYVYRNGVRIGRSTVSTGRPGHPTPTGVFTILERETDHVSTIYKGAEMPYMERLTWGGIALHAGALPGFADSHGCVRLPLAFAKKLFTVTSKGVTVIITDNNGEAPEQTEHPSYLLAATGNEATGAKLDDSDYEWNPEAAPAGPVSIIFSAKSARVFVFRNGVEIGRAVVHGAENIPVGIKAYTALDKKEDGHRVWASIDATGKSEPSFLRKLAERVSLPPGFMDKVRTVLQPGTTLVITDLHVDDSTHSDRNMKIMSAEARQ